MSVSEEDRKFIQVWQASRLFADVMQAMDWPYNKVKCRATLLRKRGVPLKTLGRVPKRSKREIEELKSWAETCLSAEKARIYRERKETA